MNRSKCPCSAEIVWAQSVNGKAQPFDLVPAERGNVAIFEDLVGFEGAQARVVPRATLEAIRAAAKRAGEPPPQHYVAHHSTCPRAAEFHRSGTGGSATAAGTFGEAPK